MPYSGKSSVGEYISKRNKLNLFDSDELIEKIEDMSTDDICLSKGEEFFKNDECELLSIIKDQKNMILACGCGMPCHDDILSKFKKIGITVYLKVPIEILNERKEQDNSKTPIKKKDVDMLSQLLAKRSKIYQKADIIIDAQELSIAELSSKVIKKVKEYK